jgi:hypothetical protein
MVMPSSSSESSERIARSALPHPRAAIEITIGGITDATFTTMEVLERGRDADWPF